MGDYYQQKSTTNKRDTKTITKTEDTNSGTKTQIPQGETNQYWQHTSSTRNV